MGKLKHFENGKIIERRIMINPKIKKMRLRNFKRTAPPILNCFI